MAPVLWLSEAAEAGRERVGGKAESLGRLAAAGFRVPDAFVIPVDRTSGLESVPPESESFAAVLGAYRRLAPGDGAVAVRSSAVGEDSAGASFAGQHTTVLDVCGEEPLANAIRDCLASLYSEAAVAYREKSGSTEPARMAVVVQRMVPAEAAGVAFSIDPLTGDTNRVVVEAVAGLGEQLVSGQIEADRMVLARNSLEVLESHFAGTPVLTEELAREAGRAVLAAEEAFGSPQDIEFAWAEGTLWTLQSRPVTTMPQTNGGGWTSEFDTATGEEDYWTSANVQEILPGILSPLTITVFTETVPRSYTADYRRMKLLSKDEDPRFVGFFYNRAFLNITATRTVADRVLGGSGDAIEHRYLGGEAANAGGTKHSRKLWKHRIVSAPYLLMNMLGLERSTNRIDRETRDFERRVRALRPESLSDAEIEAIRDELINFNADSASTHLQVTGVAGFGFENVSKLVQPILGEETEGRVPTLFTGLHGVESAQIGLDLWELSRVAKRDGIEAQVRGPGFDPRDSSLPKAWREAFGAFIDRHGHRAMNEMESSAMTWRRDPSPVIQVVASYLDLAPENSPPAALARQEAERERLEHQLAGRMNPLKRRAFWWTLRQAQGWVALRERTKSIIVRAARLGDDFIPEIQRRLVERGAIDRPDDIFFLTNREVSEFLKGRDGGFQQRVASRRREYERNRHVVLPERFRGRPTPIEPDLAHHKGDVLTGTPVSPGVVTGRARVIFDPATDGPMQPGEILVAPVTDAGWTPLFALASGLVVDMGSALSHGSTVAREYGLPAVVNVRRGTRSIRTGDLITVNGSTGSVTILEE